MATFALNQPRPAPFRSQTLSFLTGRMTFSNSYPADGESVSTIARQFKSLYALLVIPTGAYTFEWVPSTTKVKVRQLSDGNEVANGTNLSSVTAYFIAVGVR